MYIYGRVKDILGIIGISYYRGYLYWTELEGMVLYSHWHLQSMSSSRGRHEPKRSSRNYLLPNENLALRSRHSAHGRRIKTHSSTRNFLAIKVSRITGIARRDMTRSLRARAVCDCARCGVSGRQHRPDTRVRDARDDRSIEFGCGPAADGDDHAINNNVFACWRPGWRVFFKTRRTRREQRHSRQLQHSIARSTGTM